MSLPAPMSPPRAAGPLGRILMWRIVAVAGVSLAVLGLLLVTVYQLQLNRAANQLLKEAQDHFAARTGQIDAEWVRQADLLRSQIDFSGVLDGDDSRAATARLTAYLASAGGQGTFTQVLLLGPSGEVRFRYATRTRATLQPEGSAPMSWTFSPEDRLLYRTLRVPVRLGNTGAAQLVLFAPADNALLRANSYPETSISLHWRGQADLATSDELGSPHGTAARGVIRLEGNVAWAGQADEPDLHVVRDVVPVLARAEIVGLVLLGGGLGVALGWLALGRWAHRHVQRIGVLSGSTARFGAAGQLTPDIAGELNRAMHGASNELHALAGGMMALMRHVTEAQVAQRRAQQGLSELNATLEARVEERTRELARARDEALAASRAREQFLAAMSHELRTPLAGLLGGLELVNVEALPTAERQMLKVARRSGEALRSVIDGVLDYAKLEAGHVALSSQVFRADEVARDAVSLFSAVALQRGLSLTCHCAPETAQPLQGDSVRLRQVLLNLVGNALKFTDSGHVDLRVSRVAGSQPPRTRFEVQDTGVGIPATALAHLFRPFVQVLGETTRGGTGLGLAISQRLVGAMGGRITVTSTPGSGSMFAFELALPAAERVAVSPPADPGQRRELRGRVLLVDDNAVNRIIVTAMLQRLGLEVVECEDGQQALRALQNTKQLPEGCFDIVLMDCQMPVLDGPAATRRIRSGEAGEVAARLPIIAITAHATDSDAQRCLDSGMNHCLAKPFTLPELADALGLLLPQDAQADRT